MKRGLFIGLLFLGACASTAPRPQAPPKDDTAPPAAPNIQAATPEMEAVLRELLRGRSGEDQRRILESERQYEIALAYFNKGDFERAKESARRAVERWPENLAARALLSDIYSIIVGGPTPSIPEYEVRVARVATEQAQTEIAMHLLHGERYLAAKMYDSALREFESAELKIRLLPYDVPAMNELLPKLKERITRAKSGRQESSPP